MGCTYPDCDLPKDECHLSHVSLSALMRIAGMVLGILPPHAGELYIIEPAIRAKAMAEGGEALNVYSRGIRDGVLCARCGKPKSGAHSTHMCPKGFHE